tara:strand:- start:87 stop:278 length:192 start_codon:yes stop_codon:yes gene_type:complete
MAQDNDATAETVTSHSVGELAVESMATLEFPGGHCDATGQPDADNQKNLVGCDCGIQVTCPNR